MHNLFPQLVVHVVCDSSAANGSLAQLVEQRTFNIRSSLGKLKDEKCANSVKAKFKYLCNASS